MNDRFIMVIILLNAAVIYAQTAGVDSDWLTASDVICTLIFLMEMIVKHIEFGARAYWKNGWNRLDGTLVIISLPSLVTVFIPSVAVNLSFLLILRVLRVLRFSRVLHFFPNFSKLIDSFRVAMRDSYAFLLSFLVIIVIFGLLNCSLFCEADPQHFGSPLRSIYSVFQICTVEGWYEIPDTVAEFYGGSRIIPHLIRFYFSFLLLMGGIIGMSFINSIFVDAMVADNNDAVESKIDELNRKMDALQEQIEQLSKKM